MVWMRREQRRLQSTTEVIEGGCRQSRGGAGNRRDCAHQDVCRRSKAELDDETFFRLIHVPPGSSCPRFVRPWYRGAENDAAFGQGRNGHILTTRELCVCFIGVELDCTGGPRAAVHRTSEARRGLGPGRILVRSMATGEDCDGEQGGRPREKKLCADCASPRLPPLPPPGGGPHAPHMEFTLRCPPRTSNPARRRVDYFARRDLYGWVCAQETVRAKTRNARDRAERETRLRRGKTEVSEAYTIRCDNRNACSPPPPDPAVYPFLGSYLAYM